MVEPDDGGLCCGAGGIYSLLQPGFSDALREMKARTIEKAECRTVVAANPGCALQLARRGLAVSYPAELLAAALPARERPAWEGMT